MVPRAGETIQPFPVRALLFFLSQLRATICRCFLIMAFISLLSVTITSLAVVVISFIARRLRNKKPLQASQLRCCVEPTSLCKALASALPDDVILPRHAAEFHRYTNSYWAEQEREVTPACIVRPRCAQQVCLAVNIIRQEYQRQKEQGVAVGDAKLFAIRSGGHSAVHGAASVRGGVLLDLQLLSEVSCPGDRSSVSVGAGARWGDVSQVLDKLGLAVTGGRNSDVGVGGLALGGTSPFLPLLVCLTPELTQRARTGGLSFLTPRFGLVCSNILSYEIVLASGSLVTASASTNDDLWRALKGGCNNFGIVTRFTIRTVPVRDIWSGFLYMPSSQSAKVLTAFYECLGGGRSSDSSPSYHSHAAGPMACFTFIGALRVQAISVHLAHTGDSAAGHKWPMCWKDSSFARIWRLWSTLRVRTLTSATDELKALNPPGKRQILATTTIKNDLATIFATHTAYLGAISSVSRQSVKGLNWTLVLQPLLPSWACKGDPNPLGFSDSDTEPLIIVSFTVNWSRTSDDDFIKAITRSAMDRIDSAAKANNAAHPYRYLNYCAEWQKPFESYGMENFKFLQGVSTKYDPERLFQNACTGGFKLFERPGADRGYDLEPH